MTPDWRNAKAYEGVASLMPREIAWEFLRRNPAYRADFKKSRHMSGDAAEKISQRWGLRFIVDPKVPANDAGVFWRHDECTSVLVLSSARPTPKTRAFSLSDLPGFFKWRHAQEGAHILISQHGYKFQLFALGEVDPQESLQVNIPIDASARVRCAVTGRFSRFVNGEPAVQIRRRNGVYERLRDSIRILDARLAGVSYHEIAEVFLGSHRLEGEAWKTSSSRAATIRLSKLGHRLMSGGYEKLLHI